MISRIFIIVVLFFFSSPLLAYDLAVKYTNTTIGINSNTSEASAYLAFLILKASLTKNNISFDFNEYGLYKSISGYEYNEAYTINGVLLNHTGYDAPEVILWPREPINKSVVECDYCVLLTAGAVRQSGITGAIETYQYWDYGVVRLTNWLGEFLQAGGQVDLSTKDVAIVSNVSNSMPILVSDTGVLYMTNPVRIYNLNYTGVNYDASNPQYGTIYELTSNAVGHFLYLQGSTNNTWKYADTYSLQTKTLITQSWLPWQLQVHRDDFQESGYFRPTSGTSADTDKGTEPDMSEYYNGHNYLDPDDDWGQPADIGGGGSGVGGEIERLGPEAERQVQEAVRDGARSGLESYFGDPDDTDIEIPDLSGGSGSVGDGLDPEDYDEELEDVEPDDTWLTQVRNGVFSDSTGSTNLLPAGVSTFQSLVNRLKSPSLSGSLPVWTLDLEVDTGNIAGVVFEGATVDIDLNTLVSTNRSGSSVNSWLVTLRYIVVIFMTVCVLIYIIKDCMLLGGNSDVA